MKLTTITLPVLVLLAACAPEPVDQTGEEAKVGGDAPSSKLEILADSYPVAYFAEKIAGDHAEVRCPVPEGEDPITWFPSDPVLEELQEADLVVLNGAGFTKWPEKVSLSEEKVVDTAAGFADAFIRYENAVTHTHGDKEHTHEGVDGHTWMAPENMRRQAAAIADALENVSEKDFAEPLGDLNMVITGLDTRYQEITALLGDSPLLASHPAYNYVAQQYGWKIKNLDLDPGSPLDAETLASVREAHASHPSKVMLWESAPLPETVAQLEAELGIRSVVFSPCETQPETDFIDVMETNLASLKAALE